MSCIQFQTNIITPNANIRRTYCPLPWLSQPSLKVEHHKAFPNLVCSSPSYKRCSPICFSGVKGNSKSEDEPFAWDPLKRALGGFKKERTVQDLLREQLQKQEFDGNGGGGGPIGGGGDGFGGGEDESFSGTLNELLQVVLATIGFIFVYIYLIRGAELTRLARDYIKYLLRGSTTVRLRKAMRRWKRFYEKIAPKKQGREGWLERAIVATPTWWHNPEKLEQIRRARESQNAPPHPAQTQTREIDSDNELDDDDDEF
ncbi:uncharacterized protein M6B38_330655 [Iris pallida]|uniref:Uncharacterized protein n=1 Tax=Iris pallida TaxID=29817 RepID=A0AAX6FWF7_IRIPA|nr:uncharacterized protein M6B38_396380 [Iris pallida]KAJ6826664.1 uncharacterized protein M6B38_371000 [Iris pallida]KAJ6835691.1 uncharacterized protein M6B38_330655 [Iris pallida]